MEFSKIIESNWKTIVGLFLAVIVGGSAVAFFSHKSQSKEKAAQEAYYAIEKKLIDLKLKKSEPEVADKADKKTTKKDEPVDFSSIKKDLEKFIADYPQTIAAQMAALHLATVLTQDKELDAALAILQKTSNQSKGLVNTLVQQQIGLILADKDNCAEAITTWQKVLDRKEASFIHDDIKIQQALCYTRVKDFKKAEEILTNLANKTENAEMGGSSVSKEAEKYLRLLQFKKATGT